MADQNEILERVNKIYALLLMGKKTRAIAPYISKTYNVSEKTAYNYINKAKKLREEDAKEYREEAIADQVANLRNLYEKNYKIQDFRECRAILQQIAQLFALNEPSKSEVTVQQIEVDFTD